MHRIDQLAWIRQHHGIGGHSLEIASPPSGLTIVLLRTLDNDQPVRVGRENGVTGPLRCFIPIGRWRRISPGRALLGLVKEIRTDDRCITGVPLGQHDPILDPALLSVVSISRDVPNIFPGKPVRFGRVTIEYDLEPDRSCVGNHLVHALDRCQTLQVGILREVDAGSHRITPEHLVRERNPQGVKAQSLYLIEHRLVAPGPQPMEHLVARFKAKPVHPADPHRITGRIDNLISRSGQISARGDSAGRSRQSQRRISHRQGGQSDRRSDRRSHRGGDHGGRRHV